MYLPIQILRRWLCALTNGTGFDSSDKVAALTVNSLNGTVAFIMNPNRPFPRLGNADPNGGRLSQRSDWWLDQRDRAHRFPSP